tara:strand:- start:1169 stop:1411 length:243 start_codon:yes stop_codon:yes gene_type:complete
LSLLLFSSFFDFLEELKSNLISRGSTIPFPIPSIIDCSMLYGFLGFETISTSISGYGLTSLAFVLVFLELSTFAISILSF